jgi:ribosomal subunit interface protein
MNTNIALASPLNRHVARKVKIATWKEEFMNILLRAEGVELTDKLREAVNQKIGRVRQYAPRALRARVHLHKVRVNASPHQFRVRVHYEIPGNDLVAEHMAHDPLAALGLVAEKIERRLRKRKTARLARRVRDDRWNSGRWHAPDLGREDLLTERNGENHV